MAAAKKDPEGADDCALNVRLSREAKKMLDEMAAARGGGHSAKRYVLEEAIRLWHDEDPVLARARKKRKPKPEGEA